MTDIYDVTIIGGGPAGLFSAFYSGLRGMRTKIIEYQPKLGGKVLLYPEKMIWDAGGQPPVLGELFAKQLVNQGMTFQPTVCTNEKVDLIEKDENQNFLLTTHNGNKHYSKSVIVAIGGGIIQPRPLEVEAADRFVGKTLHYTVNDLRQFRDKVVMISGGGDSAVDWAAELLYIAKQVIIVSRRDKLSAHEALVKRLESSSAKILLNSRICGLAGNEGMIDQVKLENIHSGDMMMEEVDHLVVNHGYNRDSSFELAENLSLEMKDDYFYVGNAQGYTSEDGIFAAGDILTYDGKINLLVGAFQDAVNAVNSAKTYLEPSAEKVAMVSSHNKAFDEQNKKLIREMLR
ncbi:NAD(P)/FAD-dependent oxidoreductase [Ornithinibacillus xuwenensis]|uniref:Ferredoxin--NADP reductase n=1 Tax=Ornithinibacillus xuwenensis TaxID=3144668 RepID=A0ABU9XGP4_9BACI